MGVRKCWMHKTVYGSNEFATPSPTLSETSSSASNLAEMVWCKVGSNLATYGSSMSSGTCRILMYLLSGFRRSFHSHSRRNTESTIVKIWLFNICGTHASNGFRFQKVVFRAPGRNTRTSTMVVSVNRRVRETQGGQTARIGSETTRLHNMAASYLFRIERATNKDAS